MNLEIEKRTCECGTVEEGIFDKDTGLLIEGKKTLPSGQVHEGKFGEGKSLEGKITFPSGEVQEGTFDKDTGRFVEGKVTFPSGKTAYVNDIKEAA